MTKTRTGDATQPTQSESWFRTTSPDVAMHIGETSFYPHRLRLLGHSNSFGLTGCVTCVGPITVGDITYETDVALDFGEARASYTVHVPMEGWLESRHRGQQLTSTPMLASLYLPDGDIAVTRWPGGSHHLSVKIDRVAVDAAVAGLVNGPVDSPIAFNASLPLNSDAAQSWVRLLLMVHRQLADPESMLRHPAVAIPLAESLIHGLMLVTDHPYREALAAPVKPARPAAVRHAMDIIEAGPQLPLTTSTLAAQCHVSVRTLQEGFQRHLGMPPTAYVREVRLRRAHRDLRSADPANTTVAAIAHRWGFTHLGRFAAAHKMMFGKTPLQALHAAR